MSSPTENFFQKFCAILAPNVNITHLPTTANCLHISNSYTNVLRPVSQDKDFVNTKKITAITYARTHERQHSTLNAENDGVWVFHVLTTDLLDSITSVTRHSRSDSLQSQKKMQHIRPILVNTNDPTYRICDCFFQYADVT